MSKTGRPNPYPRGNGVWGIVQIARAGLPSSLWTNRSRMNHRSPPVQLPLQPEYLRTIIQVLLVQIHARLYYIQLRAKSLKGSSPKEQ